MNRLIMLGAALVSLACSGHGPSLRDAFAGKFLVGAAVNEAQIFGREVRGRTIIETHFNTLTAENAMKWIHLQPAPGQFDWEPSDRLVAYGEKQGMPVIGHTLVWHNQTPSWVFQKADGRPADRTTLVERMRDHITQVVGRYRGRIKGWDVVNEALEEDGTLRSSPWRTIIGDDYVELAFRFAREADSTTELYYNDYSIENAPKRRGAIELIRGLQAKGIPVAGVGLQGHYKMDWPSTGLLDSTIHEFAELGIKVMVTELDIDVLPQVDPGGGAEVTMRFRSRAGLNPYRAGLPDSVHAALAERYASLFRVFVTHGDVVDRVTFWGVTDADSWLNNWPVVGRTSYPLLFDRNGAPKPAYHAVVAAAHSIP